MLDSYDTMKEGTNKINRSYRVARVFTCTCKDRLNRNPPMSTNVIGGFCAFTIGAYYEPEEPLQYLFFSGVAKSS